MKKALIAVIVVVLAGVGLYYFMNSSKNTDTTPGSDTTIPTDNTQATTTENGAQARKAEAVIGKSVEGRDIIAYHFGTGPKEILFVGGIHGGYSYNTTAVAYEAIEFFKKNPSSIPTGVSVTVIPVVNPDGAHKIAGYNIDPPESVRVAARFNANNVDLNRNFDCDWQATGVWQSKTVSGGTAAFSEPESKAVRDFVTMYKPAAAVIWYSAAGGVFSSNCGNGASTETKTITNTFAQASGYPAFEVFDYYDITGDMANWLAKEKVPAISVLLTNHKDTEWNKNEKGIKALLSYYAE